MHEVAGRTSQTAATLLGFDYGTQRIGVAIGNTVTRQARALAMIPNHSTEDRFSEIAKLVTEWGPSALVVGMPLTADGGEQPMTRLARRFGNQLQGRLGLPVAWVDERYSSALAQAEGGRPKLLDAEAARIILQHYFDDGSDLLSDHSGRVPQHG